MTSTPPAPPAQSYLSRLWAALRGRSTHPAPVAAGPVPHAPPLSDSALHAQIAELNASLTDAGEKMTRMREEYATLEAEKARALAAAGTEELRRVFKKLAAPLAMLSTLAQKARNGEDVLAADLAQATASVEKALAAGGLERIGDSGSEVPYDVALHARMSGGAAADGERVILQLPGYRLGEVILQKAMVAVKEKPGQGE